MYVIRSACLTIIAGGLLAGPWIGVATAHDVAEATENAPTEEAARSEPAGSASRVTAQEGALFFHGVLTEGTGPVVQGTQSTSDDDEVFRVRGEVGVGEIDVTDPRVSGSLSRTSNVDLHFVTHEVIEHEEIISPSAETWRIENDAGAWVGQATGFFYTPDAYGNPVPGTTELYSAVLSGEGDYAGLTLIVSVERFPEDLPVLGVRGVLFPGAMPPLPDSPHEAVAAPDRQPSRAPAVAAQDASAPPWFGGRVELAEAGFAVTVPTGYVALSPFHDIERQSRLVYEAWGFEDRTPRLLRDLTLIAGPDVDPRTMGSCNMVRVPGGFLADSAAIPMDVAELQRLIDEDDPDSSIVVEDVRVEQLPAGPALVVDSVEGLARYVQYLIEGDGRAISLECFSLERPEDDWLFLAETVEFLAIDTPLSPVPVPTPIADVPIE